MKIENSQELDLVLYTDGSAIPNPGVVGFGVHGYAFKDYSETPIDEFNNTYTDKGYITEENAELNTKYVKPEYIIDMFQSSAFAESNNYAEIAALYISLDWVTTNDYSFKSILIYSDSAYVVNGVNQWLSKWEKDDFKNIASSTSWKNISHKLKVLKDKGIKIDVQWIKGHRGHLGNELADDIANIARNQGLRGNYEFTETVVKYKDYSSDKTDIHPLLSFNHLITNTKQNKNISPSIYSQYHTSLPDHQIGKASSQCSYSIVMTNSPIPVINNIETILFKNSLYNSLNLIKLDRVKSKNYYKRLVNFPDTGICNKKMSNSFVFWDGTIISPEITPPGLLLNILDTYDMMLEVLDDPSTIDGYRIDITDRFYDKSIVESKPKKKSQLAEPIVKTTLKEDIKVGYTQMSLEIDVSNNEVFIFPLLLGMDLPDRNALKRIENLNPKIELLVTPNYVNGETRVAHYYILITTTDAKGIWYYWPANMVYRKLDHK